MDRKILKTGFYNKPDIIAELTRIRNNTFDYINDSEGLDIYVEYTAYDFLMGNCHIFADALKWSFSKLDIYYLVDQLDERVKRHWYCQYTQNGKTYYIDVRGITDNLSLFLSKFINCKTGNKEESVFDVNNETYSESLIFALEIINSYKDYYDIFKYLN